MRRVLGTVAGRLFVVLLVGSVVGFNVYALTERIIHPGDWYYYTKDGLGIDMRQPGGKEIVGSDLRPRGLYTSATLKDFNARCEPSYKPGAPVLVEWRGVNLCNGAGYAGLEMDAQRWIGSTGFTTTPWRVGISRRPEKR